MGWTLLLNMITEYSSLNNPDNNKDDSKNNGTNNLSMSQLSSLPGVKMLNKKI